MIKPWMVATLGYMILRLFARVVSSDITRMFVECLTAYWIFKNLSFFMSESIHKDESSEPKEETKMGFLRRDKDE